MILKWTEYFKSLEPLEYHNLQNKLDELKSFKLPKNLIEFLQGDKLHFELDDCDFRWIEFFFVNRYNSNESGKTKITSYF